MDVVTIAILVVEILGFVGAGVVIYRMKQNVEALHGTVTAQAETLRAVGDLNRIAIEMATAFDPKKYTEAAKAYQELVEKRAALAVEDVQRELDRRAQRDTQSQRIVESLMNLYNSAVRMGLGLLAYIPMERRQEAIASA